MSIKTVVFDFGNVVGNFSHRMASERLVPHSPFAHDVIHAHIFGGQLEDDFESGRLSTPEFIRKVHDLCRLGCPAEFTANALADMFWPNQEVCDLLPRLKPHYRLLLASNTNDLHAVHFLKQFAEELANFDALVLSHQVGARKPNSAFYAYCQRLTGCEPREVLFIDDLPPNIAGAQDFGWQGIVYRDHADLCERLAAQGVQAVPTAAAG